MWYNNHHESLYIVCYVLCYSFNFPVGLKYKKLRKNTIHSDCSRGSGWALEPPKFSPEVLPASALCPNSVTREQQPPPARASYPFMGMILKHDEGLIIGWKIQLT